MHFDRYTIALLIKAEPGPELDDGDDARLQDARELSSREPAVAAGVFSIEFVPGLIRGGAMTFSPTRFPRSLAESGGSSAS